MLMITGRVRGDTFAHEHTSPRRGLKHIVDTFDPERRALLISARTDGLRYTLGLVSRHISRIVWMICKAGESCRRASGMQMPHSGMGMKWETYQVLAGGQTCNRRG